MFCLFKNSRLSLPFHLLASLLSWSSVLYWLYFSFINKSFLENVFSGKALFVDLLFGLPIVLIFAIVIYAFIYWSLKVLVILFLPHTLIEVQSNNTLSDELDPSLGDDYWEKTDSPESASKTKPSQNDINKQL